MKTVIEMALESGIFHEYDSEGQWDGLTNEALCGQDWLNSKEHKLKRIEEILTPFAELVRADEREHIITKNTPEIERCNAHIKALEDELKVLREFAAIRARSNT